MNVENEWKLTEEKCQGILENLVRINTCQPEGNEKELVDAIISTLPEFVSYEEIRHVGNRSSLIVKFEGTASKGGIAFVGHLDTVACGELDKWKYSPHQAKVENGILYGRGSADMKGGDTAMLLVIEWLISQKIQPKKTIYFCFTADEESTGLGIRTIAESHKIDNIDEMVVCEPSGGRIGSCEKGALWMKGIVKGRSCHASRPELGVNAIENAMTFINQLKSYVEDGRYHDILGTSSASVTRFDSGIMTNIIPEKAEFELDIRTIPGTDHDAILKKAGEICQEMMSKNVELSIDVSVMNDRPALETDLSSRLVKGMLKHAEKFSISMAPKGLYFYTDASQFIPRVPVPFVIAGPGEDTMAHCINERIRLKDIVNYTRLYITYLEEYYTD